MTDYVLIPGADYKAICDAVRRKSGKTELLKSGVIPAEIDALGGELAKDATNVAFGPDQIDPDEMYKIGYNWFARLVEIAHEMAGSSKNLTPEEIIGELRRVIYIPQGRASSDVPNGSFRVETTVKNPVVSHATVSTLLEILAEPYTKTRLPHDAPVVAACYETTAGTSLAGTLSVKTGDWVLATVSARSAMTYPEGWTLLHETAALDESNLNQRMAFLCRQAEADETLTVTVEQAESLRLYMNLIAVTGVGGFAYHDGSEYITNTQLTAHEVEKQERLPVIWGCSANLWATTSPYPVWTCDEISANVIALSTTTQGRLGNFYDPDTGTARTFAPGATSAAIIDYVEILTT